MKNILFFLLLSIFSFGQNSVKDSLVTNDKNLYTISVFKFDDDLVYFPRTDNENKFLEKNGYFILNLSQNIKLTVYQKEGSKWEMEQKIFPTEFKNSKCIENSNCSKDFLRINGIPTLYMYDDFYKSKPKVTIAQFLYYLRDKIIVLELSAIYQNANADKTELFKEFNKIGVERFLIKEN